jgi:hypothetical protein
LECPFVPVVDVFLLFMLRGPQHVVGQGIPQGSANLIIKQALNEFFDPVVKIFHSRGRFRARAGGENGWQRRQDRPISAGNGRKGRAL